MLLFSTAFKQAVMRYTMITLLAALLMQTIEAQPERWQQRVEYDMKIDFDVNSHQFDGEQQLKYFNHSPDTLHKVFYHLYFNAFQPGSMMDVRSRTIADPDRRVGSRIYNLADDEIGYQKILELKQDGKEVKYEVVGTILEVLLDHPILPGKTSTFKMKFKAQVPVQIRRSGRHNAEGIEYSMAQWYPKMCEYDYQGWHANPYVGREFYGVWGDFKVEIKIDDRYVLGGTGVLQNKKDIGRGYSDKKVNPKGKKETWKFEAKNVHDFMWAADPDYTVDSYMTAAGVLLYFLYQPGERTTENWKQLPKVMDAALTYMNKRYGTYPYPEYSFVQGGDGGMEYPMATLITGERSFGSLVGVSVHEWMHSWYQMVLGTNESLYAWMDEGFTSFASSEVMNYLRVQKLIPGTVAEVHPNEGNIRGYVNLSQSGYEEPLTTHSDHFTTNSAYGAGAYTKGAAFMAQLGYVIGEEARDRGLLRYFNTWKFKHPNVNDMIRVMEKESGLELDWYKEYFIHTTHSIDYAIDSVIQNDDSSTIYLSKKGRMPMPVDLIINYDNGSQTYVYIPLQIMRGEKKNEYPKSQFILGEDWPWTNPDYRFSLPSGYGKITSIEIDPSYRMADINRDDNLWVPVKIEDE